MIITNKSFLDNYLHQYHAIRVEYLSRTLSSIVAQEPQNEAEKKEKSNIEYCVRIDIRANAFHAAETLLDFLSVLITGYEQRVDEALGKALLNSKPDSAYKLAKVIHDNADYLNILNEVIEVYGHTPTVFQYCFHFSFTADMIDYAERVEATKRVIREAVTLLCDRREYNAYKHSLRAVPNPYSLMMFEPKEDESTLDLAVDKPVIELTANTVVTYWTKVPKNDEALVQEPVHSKSLESAKDLNLATLCSMLVGNIICCRKRHFGFDETYDALDDIQLPTMKDVEIGFAQTSEIDKMVWRVTRE